MTRSSMWMIAEPGTPVDDLEKWMPLGRGMTLRFDLHGPGSGPPYAVKRAGRLIWDPVGWGRRGLHSQLMIYDEVSLNSSREVHPTPVCEVPAFDLVTVRTPWSTVQRQFSNDTGIMGVPRTADV